MISAGLFGTHFGENMLTEAFQNRKCGIALKMTNDTIRFEWIINGDEAKQLIQDLQKSLDDAAQHNLQV